MGSWGLLGSVEALGFRLLKRWVMPLQLANTRRQLFGVSRPYGAVTIRPSAESIVDSLPILSVVSIPAAHWIAFAFALLLATFAQQGFKHLRHTTLGAPCLWVAASACSLAIGTFLETRLEGITLSATGFAIATTTLCPLMAVLGARRPQDRGWQWVVFTLWIVLVWPAAQAVALPAGVKVELFVAWKIFLWILIALGVLNYLPTRHWRATILVALGQVLLLREHLGLSPDSSPPISELVAYLSLLSAAGMVANARNTVGGSLDASLASLDSHWLSFRNSYGSFWALRLLGRVNQSAEQRNWPLRLEWSGLVKIGEQEPSPEQLEELRQTMDSVLRRFV